MPTDINVLIVDDSAVVRQVFGEIINQAPGLHLMAVASDPVFALQKMAVSWPDVIILDVEMPRMDGITFLKKIMAERPTPVIICSTLTTRGAETSLQALSAGAVEVLAKPTIGLKDFLTESAAHLVRVIKTAAQANMQLLAKMQRTPAAAPVAKVAPPVTSAALASRKAIAPLGKIIACGTSTGGTRALEVILTGLPENCPGMVVVQHMPEKFTAAFASRLDRMCQCEVREACDGDAVLPGRVLIAPGGKHMQLKKQGTQYAVRIFDGPPVNRHRPSVDVLFRSVAQVAGSIATGIIMTGMGDDGAAGLLTMREAGSYTIAQDQQSSVVFGMPKMAIERGAACEVMSLSAIATWLAGETV